MTKLETCAIEDTNPGQVNLYPEGAFYKAYQKSAWLLCTRVHPFKVIARDLKGLDGPLLSVGFPKSSCVRFILSSGGGGYGNLNSFFDTVFSRTTSGQIP